MSERENFLAKTAGSSHNHSCKRPAYSVGDMHPDGDLVGNSNRNSPCYLGHFRLAGLAKQILVKTEAGEPTMSKSSNKKKPTQAVRPNSSSDIRLTPQFRSPVDIERLGKALVAIALKQAEFGGDGVAEDKRNGIQNANAKARQGTDTQKTTEVDHALEE